MLGSNTLTFSGHYMGISMDKYVVLAIALRNTNAPGCKKQQNP